MENGSKKTGRPVGKAAWIGLVTGMLAGVLLGEIWGGLESTFRWMQTHDYQVVKAIHGSVAALVSHSGMALHSGLFLAVFCGVIGSVAGLVTGMGMAALGVRWGPGYEWILISMLGILSGMWATDGFNLPFYTRMIIVSMLTAAIAGWLTVYWSKRLVAERLIQPPFRHWMWAGYLWHSRSWRRLPTW